MIASSLLPSDPPISPLPCPSQIPPGGSDTGVDVSACAVGHCPCLVPQLLRWRRDNKSTKPGPRSGYTPGPNRAEVVAAFRESQRSRGACSRADWRGRPSSGGRHKAATRYRSRSNRTAATEGTWYLDPAYRCPTVMPARTASGLAALRMDYVLPCWTLPSRPPLPSFSSHPHQRRQRSTPSATSVHGIVLAGHDYHFAVGREYKRSVIARFRPGRMSFVVVSSRSVGRSAARP